MTVPDSPYRLREDALTIWRAGLDAVDSRRLVREAIQIHGDSLVVAGETLSLLGIRRICVVGAGKAGAGMAAGLEEALGEPVLHDKKVLGWINVPAGCERKLSTIQLHAARPAGVNEPTEAGVAGVDQILRMVAGLQHDDLCVCLLSGGGSALLPAPVDFITLEDKRAVTRHLSAAGANITELNTVRKQLSRIKGGGLARACNAGRLISLIISDVLGDSLDVIASGPTVEDGSTPEVALEILAKYDAQSAGISAKVFECLAVRRGCSRERIRCHVSNCVIGNNATAVDAAGQAAERLGYEHAMTSAISDEGAAEDIGCHLAEMGLSMRHKSAPNCLVSGGEPVVKLVNETQRGLGGRNQQLVLAALRRLWNQNPKGIVILSGGTDGEDGPTDAAGALLDEHVIAAAKSRQLDPEKYLATNDAYHFFEALGALIKTGPTHTNVCDLRVVLVEH